MKQVTGKTKSFNDSFLERMITDGIEAFIQNKMVNGFNEFFKETDPKLVSLIPHPLKNFKKFVIALERVFEENFLQENNRKKHSKVETK